jgi:hypothetical protein
MFADGVFIATPGPVGFPATLACFIPTRWAMRIDAVLTWK